MLSAAKSASVQFWLVVQLFAPPHLPYYTPCAENLIYNCSVFFFWMSTMCA